MNTKVHHDLPRLIKDAQDAASALNSALAKVIPPKTSSKRGLDVLHAVAEAYHTSPHIIIARNRQNALVWPRFVAAYLCRKHTRMTLCEVAALLGGRNHGTIMHAIKRVADEMSVYPERKREVDDIAAKLARN